MEAAVRTEASAAENLHCEAGTVGEPARSNLRRRVEAYVRLVIEDRASRIVSQELFEPA